LPLYQNNKRDIRRTTAIELGAMENYPEISPLFLNNGFISEPEDDEFLGTNLALTWRHEHITQIFHHLDQAYVQLAKNPRVKGERRNKINSLAGGLNPRITTEPPFLPPNIPKNWIKPSVMAEITPVEQKALDFLPPVDLGQAILFFKQQVSKPSSMDIQI